MEGPFSRSGITNFNHLKPPESGAAFPRLTELHLQGCMVTFGRLQRIVDATPHLATLHLDASSFPSKDNVPKARWEAKFPGGFGADSSKPVTGEESFYRLVCPTVTTLIFANYNECVQYLELEGGLEIEAPRLQYFRYHGVLVVRGSQVLLRVLAASNVIQADLHIIINAYSYFDKRVDVPFWRFVHDFGAAKVLRLKMDFAIEDVAIINESQREDLLGNKFFLNLERLELEGHYQSGSRDAAVTIANFLHCCPVVRDICLKLKICPILLEMPSVGTLAQLDFSKSIDRLKCSRRAMVLLGGDDDWNNHKVSDIPGLSEHSFACLQSSLKRVGLQFWMEKPNCFGVQLVKFFANNAVLLEEMQIDDGNQMMCEHMNSKIQTCLSKRKNLITVTSFRESYHPSKLTSKEVNPVQ